MLGVEPALKKINNKKKTVLRYVEVIVKYMWKSRELKIIVISENAGKLTCLTKYKDLFLKMQ